jgi:hypothetical protein
MKHLFLVVALLCPMLLAGPAAAEDFDWKKELKRDLVTVEDGKMKYSQYEVCTREGNSKALQFLWTAEAPAKGLISRDQFISNVTGFNVAFVAELMSRRGMTLSDFIDKVTCKPVDEPIGNVDIKLGLVFASGGLQIQISGADKKDVKQMTMTWEQVFEDY